MAPLLATSERGLSPSHHTLSPSPHLNRFISRTNSTAVGGNDGRSNEPSIQDITSIIAVFISLATLIIAYIHYKRHRTSQVIIELGIRDHPQTSNIRTSLELRNTPSTHTLPFEPSELSATSVTSHFQPKAGASQTIRPQILAQDVSIS
ncbi:hypothetical protein AOQ84DRAFT_66570 [Glonium stellatum]|uniref:Uncharacterized protein n=1 Tax=Glonium stellatum TaxID=574774 RepID=A0A8E2JRZ7_9PEZI|nr:hypothetical protein AOQ84DRAFT_66570 [Glonium stellatum]